MTNKELYQRAVELMGKEKVDYASHKFLKRLVSSGQCAVDSKKEKGKELMQIIIDDLNARAGTNFRLTEQTVRLIKARIADKFTIEDFKKVHEVKCAQWRDDAKFRVYLRPKTLYAPSHFEGYRIEWDVRKVKPVEKKEILATEVHRMERERELRDWREFETYADLWGYVAGMSKEEYERYPLTEELRQLHKKYLTGLVNKNMGKEWFEVKFKDIKEKR